MKHVPWAGIGRGVMVVLLLSGLAVRAAVAAQDDAARQYAVAADLQGRGEFSQAASAWREFIAQHKRDERMARAYENLGVCLYQEGKYAQAVEALEKAVAAKDPKDAAAPRALSMAAQASLKAGAFPAALQYVAKFQAAHPGHALLPDVLHVAAESDLQLGKLAEADAIYSQLIEKYPSNPAAELWKVRRGAILHAQKKYEETIRYLDPLVAELRSPDCVAEARYLVGESQLELKQPGEAAKSLAASWEVQPTWRQAFETGLALAEAYRQTGDLAGAQTAIRRAIDAFPQDKRMDRATYRLGTYLTLSGQPKAAAEAYRKVVDRWPESPVAPYALHELGCAQLTLKDVAGAETAFTKLLDKRIPDALARKARYARAMARQQQAKPAEAIADLEAVLAGAPAGREKSDARFLLGLCRVELKQYDKAVAAFQGLLTDDPKYAARDEALHQWAWALKRAGRDAEASAAFAKLADEYPKSPLAAEAHYHVAETRFRAKDYARAAVDYYAVVDQAGGSPLAEKAAYQLAWCYYHQGSFADAGKTFKFYLAKYPDGPSTADAAAMEAECLFKQGQAAEALAAYAKLKPLPNPDAQAAVLLHAGQAAAQLARWPESAAWLEKLVGQQPASPMLADALCELGVAQQHLGKPAEALAAWRQAIATSDREPAARAQFLIGRMQSERNDSKEALKSFLKVLYGYSYPKWQAEAAYEAARCFEKLGQRPEAVGMYRGLVEKFPTNEKIDAAKERLAELQGDVK